MRHGLSEGYIIHVSALEWFGSQYVRGPEDVTHPHLSINKASSAGLPPTLILTNEYDPLRDEAEAYGHQLADGESHQSWTGSCGTLSRSGTISGSARSISVSPWLSRHRARPAHLAVSERGGVRYYYDAEVIRTVTASLPGSPGQRQRVCLTSRVPLKSGLSTRAHRLCTPADWGREHHTPIGGNVLAHIPTEKSGECEQLVADVAEVARAHGIGLVIAGDPHDYRSWAEREEIMRIESDPEKLDNFLSTQMSENAQKKILLRLR